MPWSKNPPTQTPSPTPRGRAAVPTSEAIRRAALGASWARDHRVARRRLALRWLLWAGWRIGLPVLIALAVAAWLL